MKINDWLIHALVLCVPVFFQMSFAYADVENANASPTRIFIAGDSTAATYSDPDQQGWGAVLENYINTEKAEVINRARGGRSTRTFIAEGSWQTLIDEVAAGDIVIIQFGHNDASPVNDESRARGTLRGIGNESVIIDNLLTKQRETVYTYGHYLRKMVGDVRAKDATPLLMSLTQSNVWQGGKLQRDGRYGRWAYEIALELDTHFVDLNNLVAIKMEALGEEKIANFYPKDNTHFNLDGAVLHAETALAAFKGLPPDVFSKLLNGRGIDVVVCSPVPRKLWDGKKFERSDSYPRWARAVAMQSDATFIDLHNLIADEYQKLGPKKVDALFADKHTHTSRAGAELNARIVADELKPLLGL